jgi:DNA primase
MSLSPQFLDEVRARTLISSVVGKQVKLTRAGREWKACCPFHNEKTPSFTVNDEKGFYHCFGCGAHGDAIRFLTDARGLQFMDAVKELADAAGMQVPAADPQAQQRAERAKDLYDVMEAAAAWFEEQLGGIEGAGSRAYLVERGISDATRKRFRFGYAPDSRGKLKAALKEFGTDKLVEAGLLIAPDDEREPYDRFRGRLTYPIRDQRGRVIAFSARILGAGEPKYLNSPDTPLFDKGRSLFNIDLAAPASREAKRVIVVEGQMDVIALDQAGLAEAVAPLGTALTETQLALLWKLSPCPILCFDGDAPGQKAALRGALRALPHVGPGRSLSFATLPAGQDPDDLIRAKGRAALEKLLENAEPLVDRLWRYELEAEPHVTPEQRAGLRHRLLDHVGAIADANVREQYRAEFLQRFYAKIKSPARPWTPSHPRRTAPTADRFLQSRGPLGQNIKAVGETGIIRSIVQAAMLGVLRHPSIIYDHLETIDFIPLADRRVSSLRDAMLEAALLNSELDQEQLNTILAGTGAAALMEELHLERGLAFSFTRKDADPERACRDLVLVIDTLAARPGLDAALEAATARLKEQGDEAAFQEQQRLRAARDEADRQLAALIEGDAGLRTD